MSEIGIIRQRGQLTIPDTIRKSISWVSPLSVVLISIINKDEIIIRPHKPNMNENEIFKKINKSRNIIGNGNKSALDFIIEDRSSH